MTILNLAFGIVALILSIVFIFIPFYGGHFAYISAFFAALSGKRWSSLGIAALIINLINIFLLSPSFMNNAIVRYNSEEWRELAIAIGVIVIQFIAAFILYLYHRHARRKAELEMLDYEDQEHLVSVIEEVDESEDGKKADWR
ncbi:MAG: hypothetical protein HQL50_12265 [Magnetococcales bacterium]|nr:hypothetical protein [Magnetococcales bacterium]